jgi:hypothetical protein
MSTAATPDVRVGTSVGVNFSMFVPSPSWKLVLLPQHLSPPVDVIAQLEVLPVVIEPFAVC